MDFFSFFLIAAFIYGIFAKKDKPPQRRPGSPEDNRTPTRPQTEAQGRKGNIFENLERQLRETAEKFEQELQGEKTVPPRPATVKTLRPRQVNRPAAGGQKTRGTRGTEGYPGAEGMWGTEGRSEYDRYVSSQGSQGAEGMAGQEGTIGSEGAWGTEGTWGSEGQAYRNRPSQAVSAIEKSAIGVSPIYAQEIGLSHLGFSPKEVVQGIIWAEVLKEPKGKRALSRRF